MRPIIVLHSFGMVHLLCHVTTSSTSAYTFYSPDICTCPCNAASLNLSLEAAVTAEEAREKALNLEKELTVDRKTTSVAGRMKLSQPDPRASATSIGIVGTAFLVLVFMVLCLSDMFTFMKSGQIAPIKKKLKKSTSIPEPAKGEVDTEDPSNRSVVDASHSDPVTHVSHTTAVHFSVTKLLHSMNKSIFHFPVLVRDRGLSDGDFMINSFPMNYTSEPLLHNSPTKPAVLFRRPSSRLSVRIPLQDRLQQEDAIDDNFDILYAG